MADTSDHDAVAHVHREWGARVGNPGRGQPFALVRSDATTEGWSQAFSPSSAASGFSRWFRMITRATSEGLYVLTDALELTMASGDYARVSGKIREVSGQTLLQAVRSVDDIEVVTGTSCVP